MDFMELAKARYSVRKFKSTPVEDDKLAKIIEAGRIAPTAVNAQPQIIYVVKSPEGIEKAAKCSACTYGAPLVFIFGYDRDRERYSIDSEDHMGAVDIDIVQTHMMLEAAELGLGTCWVKLFDAAATRKAFDIPANVKLTGFMPCGYAADDAEPSPRHEQSRPIEEMVFYV